MGYILDPISLATDGFASPVEFDDGDPDEYCLAPFALISHGVIVLLEDDDAGKMADPYTGPARFREPFDRGYYIWKYGKPATQEPEPERPEQVRSSFIFDAYREEVERQAEALTSDLERQAAELSIARAQAARDIRELELYIAELTREIESDLLRKVAEQEADQVRQQALIARLEENRLAARDALLLVLERQRRQNNQLLAIESVIRFYF